MVIDGITMTTLRQKYVAKATKVDAKEHSTILLSLGDEVLREVCRDLRPTRWEKLQTLYMKKSLANKLYLKRKL